MATTKELQKEKMALRKMLRRNGHKATGQRLAVLATFKEGKRPMSAQEIIAALPRRRGGAAAPDQATVYRTLAALKTSGIIRQVDLRHNHAHYELADVAEHHHLICVRCGKVEDVRHCGIEAVQVAALRGSKHFAEIKQHSLEFYGTCKACAAAPVDPPGFRPGPLFVKDSVLPIRRRTHLHGQKQHNEWVVKTI